MRHSLPQSHQFYVTAPQPCPYLPGKVERKLFTALQGEGACHLNDVLSHQGFRRSQNVLYRPSCAGCSACLSARIVVGSFAPTRSQRRVMRRNADLERAPRVALRHFGAVPAVPPLPRRPARYRRHGRHGHERVRGDDRGDRRSAAWWSSTVRDGELVAVCLTDVLSDGVSMVYSFFDPDLDRDSLGSYVILDHIAMAAELRLQYVYLGYWVPGSAKMDYKSRFQPLEIFADGRWGRIGDLGGLSLDRRRADRPAISEQVAAIELPLTK